MSSDNDNKNNKKGSTFNRILKGGVISGEERNSSYNSYSEKELEFKPIEVKIGPGMHIEKGIKIFKSIVQKEKLMNQLKLKSYAETKSQKKRRKIKENKRKRFELEAKNANNERKEKKASSQQQTPPNKEK